MSGCYQSNFDITRLDASQRAQTMIKSRLHELADDPDALATVSNVIGDTLDQPLSFAAQELAHDNALAFHTPQELAAFCNRYANDMDLFN